MILKIKKDSLLVIPLLSFPIDSDFDAQSILMHISLKITKLQNDEVKSVGRKKLNKSKIIIKARTILN